MMHCPICGRLEGPGKHHCPASVIEALDRADRRAAEVDELDETDDEAGSFAERLERGCELLSLASD